MSDTVGELLREQARLNAAKDWIRSKHTAIWGYKGWDTQDEGELTEAAEYWLKEYDDYVKFCFYLEDPNPPLDMADPTIGGWSPPTLHQHEFSIYPDVSWGPADRLLPGTHPDDDQWHAAKNRIIAEGIAK